jgi:DNA-binding NarL/FixJ family response regulator
MDDKVRIVIADDHPVSRHGLRQIIDMEPDLQVVGEAADGDSALELIQKLGPGIAILDINMPRMDGMAVTRYLREQDLPVDVIFLTIYREERLFNRALDLNVKGYVLKDSAASDIVSSIRAVANGQHYTSPAMTSYLVKRTQSPSHRSGKQKIPKDLTPTEQRILFMIAEYKTSKEIADELGISRRTVETHRTNICQKLEIHGSHALMKFALEHKSELN